MLFEVKNPMCTVNDPKRIVAVAVPAHILKVTLPEAGGAFSGCCAACLT